MQTNTWRDRLKWIAKRYLRYNPDGRFRIRMRSELPSLLCAHGLTGEGAEIGVQEGVFSACLLSGWSGRLYSIDAWQAFPADTYEDVSNVNQARQNQRHEAACQRLAAFGDRSIVLRLTSTQAAERFQEGQLDFVYLDARHDYEAVAEDIRLWRPKIHEGGFLMGHDYIDGTLPEGVFGVKRAVDDFVRREGLRLAVTRERWPSWCVPL